ncbi:MAG: ATP-dependent DNA helicase RecG [Bacillaceae bacterium]|nr:ATP-dependent DNA helicase RecG [Bacillaceae bacterium]
MKVEHTLNQSVTAIKGVGEKQAEHLKTMGIETIGELLEYYPYRYDDYRIKDLHQAADGEKITVKGVIHSQPSIRFYGKKKSRLAVRVMADGIVFTAVWFNRHFLKKQLQTGREILLTGKWDRRRMHLTVTEHHIGDKAKSELEETIQPVYSSTGSISSRQIRNWITRAFDQYGQAIEEILPTSLMQKYKLMPRKEAIREIHFPTDTARGKQARRRLAFEELFLFQLKMQSYRYITKKETKGAAQPIPMDAVRRFVSELPFSLTEAQKRVVKEILDDLKAPSAMNRLLQGDVGSGKTVVAAIALYASVKAGYQGALMVPTEILAEQHVQSLKELLTPHGIEVALLSGRLTARQRQDILGQLQMGFIDVIVGTHALIQKDVYFHNLGLVITDEQHRFGVEQRRILREKGLHPDVLFMTATPIPRTLAITAFGDMDVSTIDQMPEGRKPVETYWVRPDMFDRVVAFIEKEVNKGRQAYVICPLIEESDKLDVQNAIDIHARLTEFFPQHQVGLLHGRLNQSDKEQVMEAFAANRVKILVSTTVVEVGVNVPNATVMVIYDAERFGLAQLHQLRGRVGRGQDQAYCILIADPSTEEGKERMRVMTETTDGFEVSRRDLQLRGPGDFFGTKQSGLPDFKIADITRDYKALEVARQEASELVQAPDFWTDPEYLPLNNYLKSRGIFENKILD